ncbi:MAG: N-acetylornithine carbamoyltransferase [Phycisphaerae bacterium]|nr:N-acetylornithine carbamoyltransferase [Phycisphaerae bacterium]MCZ2398367.1 N-acetylornithine carbamoyltransferase [Phycisphaerae bacterium]
MRHWLSMLDYTPETLAGLVGLARRIKAGEARDRTAAIREKILVQVFFNPSLRTRTSFEAAMLRFGGHAICLNVGGDTWKLEHRDGVRMDGDAAEHVKEAVPVLARYGDALAVRTFAALRSAEEDAREAVLRAFGRYSSVPVINMESAVEHPCQGLADWMTCEEKLAGGARGKHFVVTWAPQVKGLPMAVPHSAVLAAAAAGMNVTIAHPPGYELGGAFLDKARQWSAAAGASLSVTHEQFEACRRADALYVKSWGASGLYGDARAQADSFRQHAGWTVDVGHLGPRTILMHCLPVRRNVVIGDAALDDPRSVVVDQAENRMWAQAAILCDLFAGKR